MLTFIMISTILLGNPVAFANSESWYVINDTVMGGVSESEVVDLEDGSVLFRGFLSLDNNGGFVSTRTLEQPTDWTHNSGIQLRVRGDGRSYIATIRTRYKPLGKVYYRQTFQTVADEESTINLPFEGFEPYAYGRRLYQAPKLTKLLDQIGSAGVMLADKQAGRFQLQIMNLQPYYDDTPRLETRIEMKTASLRALISSAIDEGVPLYNSGQASECADRYQQAINEILLLEDSEISENQRKTLNKALTVAGQSSSEEQRAWALRRGLDWMLMVPASPF